MSQFHLKERRLGGHQGPQHSLIASFPSRELHDFCLMSRCLLPDILKGRHKSNAKEEQSPPLQLFPYHFIGLSFFIIGVIPKLQVSILN